MGPSAAARSPGVRCPTSGRGRRRRRADADEAEVEEVADTWADEDDDTTRVRGVGEPVGLLPARRRGVDDETAEPESALPRCSPTPPPPLPPGTSLVVEDDDELDLHDLGTAAGSPACGGRSRGC